MAETEMTLAQLQARIAENEAEQARLQAEREDFDRLLPMRNLRGLGDQAMKDPESIDWPAAIRTLEAALLVARSEDGSH